jgi:cold shock CspA family protein
MEWREMYGIVRKFDSRTGKGFVSKHEGGKGHGEIFFNGRDVEDGALLRVGDCVAFETIYDSGRHRAVRIAKMF